MSPAAVLQLLDGTAGAMAGDTAGSTAGGEVSGSRAPLRALDRAFARFLVELEPTMPASLVLAAALLANLEGRGHSCLSLRDVFEDSESLLDGTVGMAGAWRGLIRQLVELGPTAAALRSAWTSCSLIEVDPDIASLAGDEQTTPLVLHGERLYLRRYWRYEAAVATQIRARTVSVAAQFDVQQAREWLDRLFARTAVDGTAAGPDWQKIACAMALRGRLTIITGGPGTGKTFTAARLLVLLQALHQGAEPLRIALAAPTGKAAARLRQSIDLALQGLESQFGHLMPLRAWAQQLGSPRTLHALLGARPGTRRLRHDASNPLDVDVLFVDEASMVHLEMMASLLEALPPAARVILLGDKDQLASVEAGAVLGDLCQETTSASYSADTTQWLQDAAGEQLPPELIGHGSGLAQQTVMLRQSRRFSGPIGQLAQAVNAGDAAGAAAILRTRASSVVWLQAESPQPVVDLARRVATEAGAAGGYRDYLEALAKRPGEAADFDAWVLDVLRRFDGFRVLCALRDGPWGVTGLNLAIERSLAAEGLISRRGEWYEGRPIMVTRNDSGLGVLNGDIGVVLRSAGRAGALRAYFADGATLRSVAVGRLADVQTAYAMTVHKSQGSEFGHVALVLPDQYSPVLTRELVYTGITRSKDALTLVGSRWQVLAMAIARLTKRASGLRSLL